jgi:transposase
MVRWRRVDLVRVIKTRFNVTLAERGAGLAGVHGQVVNRWNGWHRGEGAAGLRDGRRVSSRKDSGILSVSDARRVHRCIRDKMPDQMKPPFALWTAQAVRELIYQKFGKTLGLSPMPLYLKRWGFTAQKSLTRATSRDPQRIAARLRSNNPRIAARAKREKAAIH